MGAGVLGLVARSPLEAPQPILPGHAGVFAPVHAWRPDAGVPFFLRSHPRRRALSAAPGRRVSAQYRLGGPDRPGVGRGVARGPGEASVAADAIGRKGVPGVSGDGFHSRRMEGRDSAPGLAAGAGGPRRGRGLGVRIRSGPVSVVALPTTAMAVVSDPHSPSGGQPGMGEPEPQDQCGADRKNQPSRRLAQGPPANRGVHRRKYGCRRERRSPSPGRPDLRRRRDVESAPISIRFIPFRAPIRLYPAATRCLRANETSTRDRRCFHP